MVANVLRISIIFLAVGAFTFRRTKFSTMRLQDIAALRGASGLLETLQWTTISVAFIGVVIALCGFAVSLMTGYWLETILLGGVALVVLLYCYPRRAAWQKLTEALGEEATGEAGRVAKGTIA
jgi:Flp pilus assembly protein TadB